MNRVEDVAHIRYISHGMEGGIEVLHNNGMPSADKMLFLSVPMQQLRTAFPELQPMSKTHPSAPSAEDLPEQQKMGQHGESVAFQLEPKTTSLYPHC